MAKRNIGERLKIMEPARHSRTAEIAAFLRALHRHVDAPPWIFEDAAVESLLSLPSRHYLRRLDALARSWIAIFRQRRSGLAAMRAQIVVRARFAEDALAAHAPRQYLVLAAGLDTYALRHATADMQVFELDHPATQAWKRDRIAQLPACLNFVPVDFEHDTVGAALASTSFDMNLATFVSWLGTTYYLTRAAIAQTLCDVRERTPAGTRLVLDYWSEAPPVDARGRLLLASTRIATAYEGEPIHSLFAVEDMCGLVEHCGWRIREHLTPAAQNERYLAARNDGLAVPSFAYLMELEH